MDHQRQRKMMINHRVNLGQLMSSSCLWLSQIGGKWVRCGSFFLHYKEVTLNNDKLAGRDI